MKACFAFAGICLIFVLFFMFEVFTLKIENNRLKRRLDSCVVKTEVPNSPVTAK